MATPAPESRRRRAVKALEEATFEQLPIDDLNIDHSYQRELNMGLVQRIAGNWNPLAGEPIVVSRRKNGKVYIVNGQHRASAAKLIGKETILCRIATGLTAGDEAELRLQGNVQIGERPHERFKAQLAAGYSESFEILKIVNSNGIELNLDRPDPLKGLNAISTIEAVYRIDHGHTLREICGLLSGLYKEVTSVNGSATVLRALAWFYTRHEPEYNPDWLRNALRELSPAAWTKQSREMTTTMGGSMWVSTYRILIDAYNEAAPEGGQLAQQTRGSSRLPRADVEEAVE